jgi:WD40 repeat protein
MDFCRRTIFGLLLVLGAPAAASAGSEIYSRTTLTEDGRSVTSIAFSPDGTKIVLALDDASARLKDTAGGEGTLLKWEGDQLASFLTYSPDGALIAMTTMKGISVWDVVSATNIAEISGPEQQLYVSAFSPDHKRIAVADNEARARIFDIAANQEIAVLEGHEAGITAAAYSPDGTLIATASADKTVRLWDAENGHEVAVLPHGQGINSVAFSPDGKRLVTGTRGGAAHVFDIATRREILVLKAETDDVLAASFGPDGTRIVTGSDDGSVRIWNAASGESIAVLTGHLSAVYFVAFSPDGKRIFSAGRDATGRIRTRMPVAHIPDGVTGLWYQNTIAPDTPDELARELVRIACVWNPFNIHKDGLIVSFVATELGVPPEAQFHLRCASDLSCQVFAGPPAQGLEPVDKLIFSNKVPELCFSGECRVLARCPAIAWTQEEKASGFAEAWEKKVLGRE